MSSEREMASLSHVLVPLAWPLRRRYPFGDEVIKPARSIRAKGGGWHVNESKLIQRGQVDAGS